MGLGNSFSSAITGLSANESTLSMIGENIANAQTVGFKESRIQFADVVAGASGLGVRVAGIVSSMAQGAIERTGNATDMAINGSGFFIVQSGVERLYTRNGQFKIDQDGILVDSANRSVQGFTADATGALGTVLGNLKMSNLTLPAQASTEIDIAMQLDAGAVEDPGGAAFDVNNPASTSNTSNGVTIFDSLGNAHLATVYYRKTAPNSWEYHVVLDGAELDPAVVGPVDAFTGTIDFTPGGALNAVTPTPSTVSFGGGASPNQSVTFSFGDSIASGGTGLAGSTQFAGTSTLNQLGNNGGTAGSLTDFLISRDGTITGVFNNGELQTIGQIQLAVFSNEEGLQRVGDNAFRETRESGSALVGGPESGSRGSIASESVERSNVELSRALVEMITVQRAYQANARTISTTANLLETVIQLGR